MTLCVLDSSAALAWVLPSEGSPEGDALLDQVANAGAAVPGLWPLEVANILLMAERRGRVTLAERQEALSVLADLPIQVDPHTAGHAWTDTLAMAAAHHLTVYDASYLELALRLSLPIASLDQALCRAAESCGVRLI